MTARREWIVRNLGFDPIATPAPISALNNTQVGTDHLTQRPSIARCLDAVV